MLARFTYFAVLFSSGVLLGVEAVDTAKTAPPQPNMPFVAGSSPTTNFQPYIFWAYGLACGLLFLFTLWTIVQTKQLEEKIAYLKERFRRAHPDLLEDNPS